MTDPRPIRAAAVTLLLASMLAACGGGGGGEPTADPVPPQTLDTGVAGKPCPAAVAEGWRSLTGERVQDLGFTSARQGWLVGDHGTVARTDDGGATWQPQPTPRTAALLGAVFSDADHGWAFGAQHALTTDDGGRHWVCAGHPPLSRVTQTWPLPGGELVAAGTDAAGQDRHFVSSERGARWHDVGFQVRAVTPAGTLFGVDAGGAWGRSTDRGRTFVPQTAVAGAAPLQWIGADAGGTVWALTGRAGLVSPYVDWEVQTLYRSPDDGATWSRVTDLPREARVSGLLLSADGSGWARFRQAEPRGLPSREDIMATRDGGLTWSRVAPPGAPLPIGSGTQWVDARTLVTVGLSTPPWLTADGGRSWLPVTLPGLTDPIVHLRVRRDGGGALLATTDDGRHFRSTDDGRQWAALTLPDAAYGDAFQQIDSLWFHDAAHGLAVTVRGTLLQTDDGGRHWSTQGRVPDERDAAVARRLTFATPSTAWVFSDRGLMRSLDAGRTWAPAPLPDALAGRVIGRIGFVGGGAGWLLPTVFDGGTDAAWITRDGGLTWQARPSFQASVVDPLAFANADLVLHAPDAGGLRRSTDGGLSWTAIGATSPAAAGRITRLHFADADHAWAIVDAARVYRSSDGGLTWQFADTSSAAGGTKGFTDLKFADARRGWITGENGLLLGTADGGLTWTRQADGITQSLTGLFVLDADHAWATGHLGGLYGTATAGR